MSNTRVDVFFSSPEPLTYGPKHSDYLAHIIQGMKSRTGGYCNAHDELFHHDPGHRYRVVMIIPPMAAALNRENSALFEHLLLGDYYAKSYKLTDIEVSVYD